MKIRRSELYRMMPILEGIARNVCVKFNYALGKNMRKIREEIQDTEDAASPGQDFREYEEERIKLNEKYAKKEKGTPTFVSGAEGARRYLIDESKQELFDKEIESLRKKHKPMLDQQKEKNERYIDMMKEEIEMDFHLIKFEDCPEDLFPKEWEAVSYFITDQPEIALDKTKGKK